MWTITPTIVNELHIGFVREYDPCHPDVLGQRYPEKLGWAYAKADTFPGVTIGGPGGATNIGTPGNNVNAVYAQDGVHPSDAVTWISRAAWPAMHFR